MRENRSRTTARYSHPIARWDRGDIRDPFGIGTFGSTIPPQCVGSQVRRGIAARRLRFAPPVWLRTQSQGLHQAHPALAPTPHPARLQNGMNAWTAIHLTMLLENRLDFRRKPRIFSLVSAGGPPEPGVIATHRNRKHLAHPRDRILVLMLGHKLLLHPWPREKMLIAFFTISRSWRKIATSRFKWRFSSSKGV